jgi:diguanylate cyclase (GGDEF)-like protein
LDVYLDQETDQAAPCESIKSTADQMRITMGQAARRQRRLWSIAVVMLLLLLAGIASFTLPGLLAREFDPQFHQLNRALAVRELVFIVVLFNFYVLYQQLQIHRMDVKVAAALGKIQERTEQVYKLAGRDGLTDLYNREFGEQRLAEEISRTKRHMRPLAVLRLNLEGLEHIGERLGRASADCAIRLFADHLKRELRTIDVSIRLDSGKFLIVLPECKGSEVGRILGRLNGMVFEFGEQQRTEIAAGWADYLGGDAPQTILMRAESGLHESKRNGDASKKPVHISISSNGDKTGRDPRIAKLTRREHQVFELLAHGKCNKEVANTLGLSPRTVETYRANIMSQLEIHSNYELVWFAVRNGIIDMEKL